MNSKFTQKNLNRQIHNLPAGMLPGDTATELFGCRNTKRVFGISNGQTIPFADLCPKKRATIYSMMLDDPAAMDDLKMLGPEEALEHYAFCLFGAADHIPDFDRYGKLNRADNFMCSDNCRCLKWHSKTITINGNTLTRRQIQIVQALASDMPDKQIAEMLNIAESTLDTHKRNIFELASVHSKAGLIQKAAEEKVIQ